MQVKTSEKKEILNKDQNADSSAWFNEDAKVKFTKEISIYKQNKSNDDK